MMTDANISSDFGGDDADVRAVSGEMRFLDCPVCGVTLDCFMDPDDSGFPRVVPIERVKCPRCGSEKLDPATIGEKDDAYHSRLEKGELIPAEYVPPMDPGLTRYLKEGAAVLEDSGVFGMDIVEDKEPQWPRRVCEILIGCSLYLGSKAEARSEGLFPDGFHRCRTCTHCILGVDGMMCYANSNADTTPDNGCGNWCPGAVFIDMMKLMKEKSDE